FWTSFLLRTFSLWMIFNEEGLANQLLGVSGIPFTFTTGNFEAVVWAETYAFLPFMVLPMYATMERMSRSSIEASYVLGAGRIQTFLRVILPLSMPGIVAGSLLVFIITMGEVVIPQIMGGGEYGYLFGNAILARHADVPGDMSALSLLFMAVILAFVFGYLRLAGREGLRL
ncbi:MAG: ABC transporter permease, partial [Thermoplasmata archaeon]